MSVTSDEMSKRADSPDETLGIFNISGSRMSERAERVDEEEITKVANLIRETKLDKIEFLITEQLR